MRGGGGIVMGKHTPGPWEVTKCPCGKDAICNVWQIANVGNFYQGCGFNWDDARLIAAAPDMYEALKEICNNCHDRPELCGECGIKTVLAKAEGRSNDGTLPEL